MEKTTRNPMRSKKKIQQHHNKIIIIKKNHSVELDLHFLGQNKDE